MIRFLFGCAVAATITGFFLDHQPAPLLFGSNRPAELRDAFGNGSATESVAATFLHGITAFVLKGISNNE